MMGIVGCLELFERFANYHDYDSGKHEKAKDWRKRSIPTHSRR